MTSRDRVKAAINHQTGDRAPYFIDICQDAWEVIQAATGAESIDEFLDNDVQDIHVPWWAWQGLGPEWRSMDAPTTRPSCIGIGSYVDIADNVKAMRDQSEKYFLVRLYGIHFEKAYFSRGIENFLADMAGEPEFARELLRTIIEKNLVMMENFLNIEEIDGVLCGSDWGSQRDLLMSYDIWEEMIAPGEQAMYDLIRSYGKDVWLHSCGAIERLIPRLIEMGVDVINPVQPEAMDTRKLKADYGENVTFFGGVSTQQTLPFGSPDEVKAETRAARDLLGAGGGYILAPAQSIQNDVPVANLLAFLEVAREITG